MENIAISIIVGTSSHINIHIYTSGKTYKKIFFLRNWTHSTGTILEKDAYFPSLMDRHTSRLIFCKMIKYTLYYHLSPVVEFSHGAFFC